jgi:DNA-binding XRE family transcriptional regulator
VTEEELCVWILATGLVWAGVSAVVLAASCQHPHGGREASVGLGDVFRGLLTVRGVLLREVVVSERVGLELRRIREEKGLTVEELAEKSGVSVTTIRVAERGPREPSDDTVARLARPLGLTFDEVWRLQRRRG